MDLNELKAIMASSLLAASARPNDQDQIETAVRLAQKIWEEVLKQERE